MKLSAFALLIIMLLSSCSETVQTISPTAKPSETVAETVTAIKTETSVPETTPTPTPNVTLTPTSEPTPPKKEKITKKEVLNLSQNHVDYNGCITYEKAVEILGVEGYYIDDCFVKEYQWDVDTGEYVYFSCFTEEKQGEEVMYIIPGTRDYKSYSVKDTPNFFRMYDSVSSEDCEKINEDMIYEDVIGILGESNFKTGIPMGYTLVEWVVDDGRYFFCRFYNWVDDLENSEINTLGFLDYSLKTRRDVEKILAERQ